MTDSFLYIGLGAALQDRLGSYTISSQDAPNEVQPKHVKVLRVPDYFAEYREKGDGLASFLGTSIVAKVCMYVRCESLLGITLMDIYDRSHLGIQQGRIMYQKVIIRVVDLVPSWECHLHCCKSNYWMRTLHHK